MDKIHGWIFTYNQYTKKWYAVRRDDYHALFSELNKAISSNKIETLIEIIIKTEGNTDKLKLG